MVGLIDNTCPRASPPAMRPARYSLCRGTPRLRASIELSHAVMPLGTANLITTVAWYHWYRPCLPAGTIGCPHRSWSVDFVGPTRPRKHVPRTVHPIRQARGVAFRCPNVQSLLTNNFLPGKQDPFVVVGLFNLLSHPSKAESGAQAERWQSCNTNGADDVSQPTCTSPPG